MKPLLILIAALTISCNCFAQNDTAIIRTVFDYLNTPVFRRACADSIKAEYVQWFAISGMSNKTKKHWLAEEAADTSVILGSICFVPFNQYRKNGKVFKTDTLQPLIFRAEDKKIAWPSMLNYVPTIACERRIVAVIFFQENDKVTVEYYNDSDHIAWGYKQGVSHIIELTMMPGEVIKFTGYSSVINN